MTTESSGTARPGLRRTTLLPGDGFHDEELEAAPVEHGEGVPGRHDDRLASPVERGVDDAGESRAGLELRDEPVEARVRLLGDELRASRPVDVDDLGDPVAPGLGDG